MQKMNVYHSVSNITDEFLPLHLAEEYVYESQIVTHEKRNEWPLLEVIPTDLESDQTEADWKNAKP